MITLIAATRGAGATRVTGVHFWLSDEEVHLDRATRVAIVAAQRDVVELGVVGVPDEAESALKFSECVPAALMDRLRRARYSPAAEAPVVVEWPVRVRVGG